MTQYSIAEARNHLAQIVHDVENTKSVAVTRRGKVVAHIVSHETFVRSTAAQPSLGEYLLSLHERSTELPTGEENRAIFGRLRDRSPGRKVKL